MSNKEIGKTDGEALSKAEDLSVNEVPIFKAPVYAQAIFNDLVGQLAPLFGSFGSFDPYEDIFSYNKNGSLNVTIEVPGINEADLSVNIHDDNTVTVRGETTTQFSTHTVEDTFTVPEGFRLEPEHHLENGILTLTFPLVKEDSTESI